MRRRCSALNAEYENEAPKSPNLTNDARSSTRILCPYTSPCATPRECRCRSADAALWRMASAARMVKRSASGYMSRVTSTIVGGFAKSRTDFGSFSMTTAATGSPADGSTSATARISATGTSPARARYTASSSKARPSEDFSAKVLTATCKPFQTPPRTTPEAPRPRSLPTSKETSWSEMIGRPDSIVGGGTHGFPARASQESFGSAST
mmetsp:Transcript_23946/g.80766  ORF Transcript_23946/g.80766 Transcript_23946/m.80766 type:complete len:209 (-) Transcript_23946:48-674(-)